MEHDPSIPTKEKPWGDNRDAFITKIKAMQKKWRKIGDSQETRIIAKYLFNKNLRTHANVALLADNLEYFKKHYANEYKLETIEYKFRINILMKLLSVACLSGSRRVADYLLEKLGASYSSDNFDHVLNYAAISGNKEWVRDIATKMIANNVTSVKSFSCSMIPYEVYYMLWREFKIQDRTFGPDLFDFIPPSEPEKSQESNSQFRP